MRIFVIANLPPHVMGGAEHQVARLVAQWVSLGHCVEIAGQRIPNGEQSLGTAHVRTHRISTSMRLGRTIRGITYALSLAWIALRHTRGFDVVYCRAIGDGALTLVTLKALGIYHVPIVACPINAHGKGDIAFIRSVPGWRRFVRWADSYIHTINLINDEIRQELTSIGITSPRFTFVPNGINVKPAPVRTSTGAVRQLCWTGRMEHQKGLDLLLQALSRLAFDGFEFRLTLYGNGGMRELLSKQANSLGLDERVEFAGSIASEGVREHLLEADVFLLPSRWEGMSNAALEAMESGLPVLCTRCGGIDRFVEGTAGWVCDPESDAALEHVLREMLLAPTEEILEKGRAARRLVEETFRIERVAAENLELLRIAAESRSV